MRNWPVARATMKRIGRALLPVLLQACIQTTTTSTPPPVGDAATFEAAAARTVVEDIPPTLGMTLRLDAAAPLTVDAAATSASNGPSRDGPRPAPDMPRPVVDAVGSCNLLRQDCPRGSACYPLGGGSMCRLAGGTGELGPCLEHTQCSAGLVCVEGPSGSACTPLCDVRMPSCRGRETCAPLVGSGGAGYCKP